MFKIGDEVSYGMLGRCQIMGIETKIIGGEEVSFYQVRAVKPPAVAKTITKPQPNILIPVRNAETSGLRPLMALTEAEQALRILSDGEYYFSMTENWTAKQRRLEDVIRKEGSVGLAKSVGHLYVLIKEDPVPRGETIRLYESLLKTLVNELAIALGKLPKEAEILVLKALKAKLHAAH